MVDGDDALIAPVYDGPVMPASVRAAQLLLLGLAGMGLVCAAAADWLLGIRSGLTIAVGFVPSWLLGLLACGFRAVGGGIRKAVLGLSLANLLWTIPSITQGLPPGWLGPAASIAVMVLLFRPAARAWFATGI